MNCPSFQRHGASADQGFVLIVALMLLLVLTLVGTVAMRSTTLDFRMVTNASLTQRNFEATEAARVIVDSLLDGHTTTQGGWPQLPDGSGGEVPLADFGGSGLTALADFVEIRPQAVAYPPYGNGAATCRVVERGGEGTPPSTANADCLRPDLRIYSFPSAERSNARQPDDVWTDVWVTQIGNLNFGPLVAGRPPKLSYRVYHVRAVSHGAGNAQSELSWEFRALEADL